MNLVLVSELHEGENTKEKKKVLLYLLEAVLKTRPSLPLVCLREGGVLSQKQEGRNRYRYDEIRGKKKKKVPSH